MSIPVSITSSRQHHSQQLKLEQASSPPPPAVAESEMARLELLEDADVTSSQLKVCLFPDESVRFFFLFPQCVVVFLPFPASRLSCDDILLLSFSSCCSLIISSARRQSLKSTSGLQNASDKLKSNCSSLQSASHWASSVRRPSSRAQRARCCLLAWCYLRTRRSQPPGQHTTMAPIITLTALLRWRPPWRLRLLLWRRLWLMATQRHRLSSPSTACTRQTTTHRKVLCRSRL